MPSYPHIERYQADKLRLIEFGGSDNEQSIRRAFAICLDSYCREHREKLALVDELDSSPGNRPDGTVKDSLRMARGYWEAKDSRDDLDAEIQRKFNRGYPQGNIIFEDSQTAVLFQNRQEAMRVDMSRPGELHRLIRVFLDYELPEIEEFRQAQRQFKTDLPAVINNLREAVADAESTNPGYQAAAAGFLELCQKSIGPAVSSADVREMLLQHILTKDIFRQVFAEEQFHQENNVARLLEALEQTFFIGDVRREAIGRLRAYYGAIGRAANEIADYSEKQQFLKAIYEDFYTAYNPAAADRLGVVYTPNEVVDFIIRGTDHLLQKHFGRRLADNNVQILDPATGTGTFITNLINYLAQSGEPDALERLEHKYRNEMHANEVAILPYYIANLNIEYTYKERTGKYLEFPNLCFVDTLDNMDWKGTTGGAVERQSAFNLGGLSTENWMRIQGQNEKNISVIIGNPPYNANQQNAKTTTIRTEKYPADRPAHQRYLYRREHSAENQAVRHVQAVYPMGLRSPSRRWDYRLYQLIGRTLMDPRQDDGFRKVAAPKSSASIYGSIDLIGNARTIRRTTPSSGAGNIFDDKIRDRCRHCLLWYGTELRLRAVLRRVMQRRSEDYANSATDKLAYLQGYNAWTCVAFDFREITPDSKAQLVKSVRTAEFETLIPARRQTDQTLANRT